MGEFNPDGDHLTCETREANSNQHLERPQAPRELPSFDDMPDDIEEYRNFRAEERWG